MLHGAGWYYTPISVDGQVVEKRVDSIVVSREETRPVVAVSYTLTNPYDHPVTVPIQSGLTMLYQYSQSDDDPKDPELHIVPATVTRHTSGELLYVAEGSGSAFGTTAIQRQHLGTGIPNYRHPVAVNVTLVPGDSVELEATATIPARVQRMILVDAMVGPEQPYGIYPQLIEHPQNEGRLPPPLRVYEGASFETDPPHVHMPRSTAARGAASRRLPRWIDPVRFERLQAALRHHGKLWLIAVGSASVVLGLGLLVRSLRAGVEERAVVEGVRAAVYAALTILTVTRGGGWRAVFATLLIVGGLGDLIPLAVAVLGGELSPVVFVTAFTLSPIAFLVGAGLLLGLPAIRAHTRRASRRSPARRARGGS